MKRIGVIFGGRSGEHEVSLMSATSVLKALSQDKFFPVMVGITKSGNWLHYEGPIELIESGEWERVATPFDPLRLKQEVDMVFPILHGPNGEDGTFQGMMEMLDIPYCGCNVLPSALAMDKMASKEIFARQGIPVCRYGITYRELLTKEQGLNQEMERLEALLGYPMFVKPCNMGSSVGISKVKNQQELAKALKLALAYDRRILVEEGLSCREIEVGIIGNFDDEVSVCGEILPSEEFYDYKAKYFDDGKSLLCIPAEISREESDQIRELAGKAYRAIDGCGFARADFFIEKETGKIYLNEINTIPGFTRYSMFPLLFEKSGLPYGKLLERIVELGYERYNAKNNW